METLVQLQQMSRNLTSCNYVPSSTLAQTNYYNKICHHKNYNFGNTICLINLVTRPGCAKRACTMTAEHRVHSKTQAFFEIKKISKNFNFKYTVL